jgi:hypothetical protein
MAGAALGRPEDNKIIRHVRDDFSGRCDLAHTDSCDQRVWLTGSANVFQNKTLFKVKLRFIFGQSRPDVSMSSTMDENGKSPDYAEIWVNAHRARNVCLALSFALLTAALKQGWQTLLPQTASSAEPPPGKPVEHAREKGPVPHSGKGPLQDASLERVLEDQRL